MQARQLIASLLALGLVQGCSQLAEPTGDDDGPGGKADGPSDHEPKFLVADGVGSASRAIAYYK